MPLIEAKPIGEKNFHLGKKFVRFRRVIGTS
jgi:hypothetical protein